MGGRGGTCDVKNKSSEEPVPKYPRPLKEVEGKYYDSRVKCSLWQRWKAGRDQNSAEL